ncbi:bifunctional aldehyde dehydrogenase/enoyl-CoA hydratase [Roseibium album]|nr:bifunctional aldehyde dehydrogenase/enoyl-CoA hydratase [Roseibium album]
MSDLLHFEDFKQGQKFDLGSLTVSKEDIIEFASEFDPQPFHLSEEAGEASMLGGLAASGWQTSSLAMSLLAENLLNKSTSRGSPGISKLKWQRPVFSGDTLSVNAEVLKTRSLHTKPDLGLVSFRVNATKQDGTQVLLWENPILFAKRSAVG